ncbi:TetR/AcrR family transcriptional regulator [Peterkaempfera bronchialis]|uniref:TetR family transcriptional regulator n=1 Tax=Peterkaempfera bronchialis TaxID=2126346 RepID=A0A345T6I5_9ACTN|nr:TetR/AcrR family transcriptional regulator [Peterkaempfera bronchialis]AXI81590.1 TetR family transcriptional regulator [Peterkaempfera bronchialis]
MLEEAMAAIAENGLAGLTMSGLAERLGTSGGHILYYFGSKDQLLLAALRWSEDRLTEERRALLARRVRPPRKLDLFLALYLPKETRDPRWMLWVELWARTAANAELRSAQEEIDRGWQDDLAALLADCGMAGGEAETRAAADELLALLDGLSTRVVLGLGGATQADALTAARRAAARLLP